MNRKIETLLDKHLADIDRINNQRRAWLYASSVVFVGIIFLIFSWDWLDHFHLKSIWWVVISVMLILSINWWYWTMRVVRIMLNHQEAQHSLLKSILEDIGETRSDIKLLTTKTIDLKD
jgi:uncharacterized membrane-anchored protein YitT (DUF2179 family)